MSELARRFTVGYALAPKKENSFIQSSLLHHAKQRGIDLVKIDTEKPLISQGPFDCIIHKLYSEDWKKQLEQFSSKYPNIAVIDSPEAIERLHNRISMLEVVNQLRIPQETESFGVPKQIVIYNLEALFDPTAIGDLKFPMIAKPLVADGSAKSHKMSLVFNQEGLKKPKPPIVLQEFVNHGRVIFKVYVVGEHVKCVKRKSLPDVSEEKLGTLESSLSFSQVSNLTAGQEVSDNNDNDVELMAIENAEMPPLSFITDIAIGLRQAMGLNLFNFDVIRDARVGNRYLVIDINYFPGYAKMPDYESVLTDFFWNVVHRRKQLGGEAGSMDTQENEEDSCDKEGKKFVSNACSGDGDGGLVSSSVSGEEENTVRV